MTSMVWQPEELRDRCRRARHVFRACAAKMWSGRRRGRHVIRGTRGNRGHGHRRN